MFRIEFCPAERRYFPDVIFIHTKRRLITLEFQPLNSWEWSWGKYWDFPDEVGYATPWITLNILDLQ